MKQWIAWRTKVTGQRDTLATYQVICVLYLATIGVALVYGFGNPIGVTATWHVVNSVLVITVNTILFTVLTLAVAVVLSIMYVPLPRLLLGSFSYTVFISVALLYFAKSGAQFSYLIGSLYSLLALLLGFLLVFFLSERKRRTKLTVLIGLVLVACISFVMLREEFTYPAVAIDGGVPLSTAVDPGAPGPYGHTFFTYGSGTDRQRAEYGDVVREVTPAVDASHFITKWGTYREKFWGFGPANLPVNGRVFMPDGDGPFPLFLMVHGNHTMEYLSTSGYDYLGAHLASHGIMAISVDEDFINYSNYLSIPNANYQLRAWMLLHHLAELQNLAADPGSAFYDRIDFAQVGLMGHSRGGQAAIMATDYETFFPDEAALHAALEAVTIQGVVTISPTDKLIDKQEPSLHNVSYLTVHGGRDADVTDYRGERQFYRSTFDPDDAGFMATVYIGEANHTQFNTGWGTMDLSLPRGIFLNQAETMPGEDQRQAANVFVTAFLKQVFAEEAYDDFFRDHRVGRDWLPPAMFVMKYQAAAYQPLVTYRSQQLDVGGASGFTEKKVVRPTHRRGQKRKKHALSLAWDQAATYTAALDEGTLRNRRGDPAEALQLRVANAAGEAPASAVPEVDVELVTSRGASVTLPLDAFQPLAPVIHTTYTPRGLLNDYFREGRYDTSWEPLFQTITLPFAAFEARDPAFKAGEISVVKLHFKTPEGHVYLEEIGVE